MINLKKILAFFKKLKNDYYLRIEYTEIFFKVLFAIIIVILCINIFFYSYKAWLYPIRESQYFDECSYIAMGKYFRTISPVSIYTDHIFMNKPIPEIYHEFNCRMVYWPMILSVPLTFTESRIDLHIFRAIFLALGTLIIFFLGFKLTGITGGIIASAFFVGIPLLNYWGHFLMTETPSLIFLICGYLFLLYSKDIGIASFLGGILLGIAGLTRFTTMALIFPAPFIIMANFFHPFKRKNFQVLGELAKTFAGFCLAVSPYLVFTGWMFKNPFFPFLSARSAVDNFPVDDTLYYIKNLWVEVGPFVRVGAVLGLFAPIILSFTMVIKKFLKDIHNHLQIFNKIREKTFKGFKLSEFLKRKNFIFRYLKVFFSGIVYYALIILPLIFITSIYLIYVSNIPHKLPRYLMGALVPVIIIASIGYGAFEPFVIYVFRFFGNVFLTKKFKRSKKTKLKKNIYFAGWFIGFFISISILIFLSYFIWNHTMNRPFNFVYKIKKEAIDKLKKNDDEISILRLQPEHISWKESIAERLQKVKNDPAKGIDDTNYYGKFSFKIIEYLNKKLKHDEVFYVDRFNRPPFTPAYAEVPCMYIDNYVNKSVTSLIRKGEMPYKGYLLINRDPNDDIFKEDNKIYFRSLNKIEIKNNKKFKYIKRFGNQELYYYSKGKPFPYEFGTKTRISKLYEKNDDNNTDFKKDKNSNIFDKLFHSWKHLFHHYFVFP